MDDGRSTLALSICSSLTLGEVFNISVFALPVFAVELSNASAYTFARSPEAAKINAPVQRYVVSFQIDKPRTVITVTDSLSALPTDDAAPKADDRQKSLGAYLRIKFRSGQIRSMNKKPQSTTEAQPGVFGVPLQTSIQYANAAVSLFDDEGQSYIYGYIPILVGKTGVYLKERGKCESVMYLRYAAALTKVQLLMSRTFSLLVAHYLDFVRCNLYSTPRAIAMAEAGN